MTPRSRSFYPRYAKKPELSKAERRELQEKQRAAKASGGAGDDDAKKATPPPAGKPSGEAAAGGGATAAAAAATAAALAAAVAAAGPKPLFGHLPPFGAKSTASLGLASGALTDVHPAVAALGLR
jgi:translation initiation factor eIF-2B subunit delta